MVGHEVFISQMKDQIRIFQKQNRPIMTYFLSMCAGHGMSSVGDKPTTGSYRQV